MVARIGKRQKRACKRVDKSRLGYQNEWASRIRLESNRGRNHDPEEKKNEVKEEEKKYLHEGKKKNPKIPDTSQNVPGRGRKITVKTREKGRKKGLVWGPGGPISRHLEPQLTAKGGGGSRCQKRT